MHKVLYVLHEGKPVELTIRNYTEADTEQMIAIQQACFPPPYPAELWWNAEQLQQHVQRFPDGALCAEVHGRLIGSMTGLRVGDNQLEGQHAWSTITDNGYIRNHDANGDTLYVADIAVIPEYRKAGVGKWLMQSMYEVVVQLRMARLLGGGRLPGYHRYAHEVTPEQYVEGVLAGKWQDPVLSFLLRCGRMPVGIVADYLEDEESLHYAVLMEWRNPFR